MLGFNAIRDAWDTQALAVPEMAAHRDVRKCVGSVLSGVPSIGDPAQQNIPQTSIFGGFLLVLPAGFSARSRMRRGDWGI